MPPTRTPGHDTIVKRSKPFTLIGGDLYGPRDYLEDRGLRIIEAIEQGSDPIYLGTIHQFDDHELAFLERLASDYRGWKANRDGRDGQATQER